MPALVNVENLKFEELIPLLKENVFIKDEDYGEVDETIEILRSAFDKLQKGESTEHYMIGHAMVECLKKMGRLFIDAPVDDDRDDYTIVPITLNECIRFVNSLIHKEGFQNA